jgi:hypothetical protein
MYLVGAPHPHKVDAQRMLEREIAEAQAAKDSDWKQREHALKEQERELEAFRMTLSTAAQELEQAVAQARREAVADVEHDAKIAAEIAEKEHTAACEVFELKIASLEAVIEKQAKQIEGLGAQLSGSMQQIHQLSKSAVSGANQKVEVSHDR